MLDWTQEQLAQSGHTTIDTIRCFENGRRATLRRTVRRMQAALEAAGVIFLNAGLMFIEENAATSTKVRDAAAMLGDPDHSLLLIKREPSDGSGRPSGRQIAAARMLADLKQTDLALAAKISRRTLRRMETMSGPATSFSKNIRSVRSALEAAGVIFVEENGHGPGVRLRK